MSDVDNSLVNLFMTPDGQMFATKAEANAHLRKKATTMTKFKTPDGQTFDKREQAVAHVVAGIEELKNIGPDGHEYPWGALKTMDEIIDHVAEGNKFIYGVLALGAGSSMTSYPVSVDHTVVGIAPRCKFPCFTCAPSDKPYGPKQVLVGDYNVEKHHNDHYIFAKEEDAIAYRDQAKRNRIDSSVRDSFYDYDPFSDRGYGRRRRGF